MSEACGYDAAKALRALRKADPVMGALIKRVGAFRLEPRPCESPFQGLAESIVYQQLHGKAAATILGRLKDLYPKRRLTPTGILRTPLEQLRAAGLSAAKAAAVQDLAAKTKSGLVPGFEELHALGDDEVVERCVQVRGVGRWTVEMLLMFRMARPDVLPVDDFAVRKAFSLLYREGAPVKPAEILAHGELWRPWRSVATWYLYRSLDTVTP